MYHASILQLFRKRYFVNKDEAVDSDIMEREVCFLATAGICPLSFVIIRGMGGESIPYIRDEECGYLLSHSVELIYYIEGTEKVVFVCTEESFFLKRSLGFPDVSIVVSISYRTSRPCHLSCLVLSMNLSVPVR